MCASRYSTWPPACASRVASIWSTSASLTLTRPSTSRSRRRWTRISFRISERYFAKGMPSRSTALRKSSAESLLSSAMRNSVRSTCVSSTRIPVSLAYCISTRSVISRSSTCFSRTSPEGGATPCVFIWPSTTRFCSLTSYCVSASSLTIAITRSSGTTPASDTPARPGTGAWARAVTAPRPQQATANRALHARIGDGERGMRMADLNIPGRRRREHAATRSDRWSADSRGRCAAGDRVGWCRTAPARSTRSAGRPNCSSSA